MTCGQVAAGDFSDKAGSMLPFWTPRPTTFQLFKLGVIPGASGHFPGVFKLATKDDRFSTALSETAKSQLAWASSVCTVENCHAFSLAAGPPITSVVLCVRLRIPTSIFIVD
ncbi:hypothetical protein D3C84_336390 [compost metagenome]